MGKTFINGFEFHREMGDFQAQYDGLVRRVQGQKEVNLTALTRLQQLYQDTMGCEDPLIADRISTITSAYDARFSRLDGQRKHFLDIMNGTDAKLRIAHSNDEISFDEDVVYAQLQQETDRARIKERTCTESEYWSAVFPLEETTSSLDIAQLLPTVAEPKFVTVRDELSGSRADSAFVEQINAAMNYVKGFVGTLYDLPALTREELLGLNSGLRQYMAADSPSRIEHMSNFITPRFSADQWGRLTNSERDTLTYTRKRDADSATDTFSPMTKGREDRLARIILKLYDKMVKGNSHFRTRQDCSLENIPDTLNASAIFYTEKFLLENVRVQREPLYAQAIDQSLPKVLRFHNQMCRVLGASELTSLNITYHIGKMCNLRNSLGKWNSLTPRQRDYARNLMSEYVTRVKSSPIWTQEKLHRLAAAQARKASSQNV